MGLTMITAAIAVCLIAALYFRLSKKRPKNYPPGPDGIFLLGNAFQLGRENYKVGLEMSKQYGNILGFSMGARWMVMLNNVDDIKEAFSKPEFAGRRLYNGLIGETSGDSTCGVIMSEGRIWQEQRTFCFRSLKDFGFGTKRMETIIMEEVDDLIREFKETKAKPISTEHAFNVSVFNVIWSIVAGERYARDDSQLEELIQLLSEYLASSREGMQPIYYLFPGVVDFRDKFPFFFPDKNRFGKKAFPFFQKIIQDHRKTITEGNPRDFIDAYLEEVSKTTDPNSSFYSEYSDDLALIMLLMDLFIAGAETTSTTLLWSFFLLALHGKVQDKFFTQIETVVGDRQVSLEDRPRLPYIEATINEIMRLSSLTPIGAPHATTKDVIFKGYFIPKGANIFGNQYAAHYNPSVWGDPEHFRPERFLSVDEKTVIKNKNLIPFGTGKRVCPGESLARDEVFLFLSNLVQTFHISMPVDEPKHSLRLVPKGVSTPEPHRIVLRERNT